MEEENAQPSGEKLVECRQWAVNSAAHMIYQAEQEMHPDQRSDSAEHCRRIEEQAKRLMAFVTQGKFE
jgi:hypothetical protein